MSNTESQGPEIPADVMADLQAAADHLASGSPLDPTLVHRVQERARQITSEIQHKYEIFDIGVPALRELRGVLPES
jgi:hypothetical protein